MCIIDTSAKTHKCSLIVLEEKQNQREKRSRDTEAMDFGN